MSLKVKAEEKVLKKEGAGEKNREHRKGRTLEGLFFFIMQNSSFGKLKDCIGGVLGDLEGFT